MFRELCKRVAHKVWGYTKVVLGVIVSLICLCIMGSTSIPEIQEDLAVVESVGTVTNKRRLSVLKDGKLEIKDYILDIQMAEDMIEISVSKAVYDSCKVNTQVEIVDDSLTFTN